MGDENGEGNKKAGSITASVGGSEDLPLKRSLESCISDEVTDDQPEAKIEGIELHTLMDSSDCKNIDEGAVDGEANFQVRVWGFLAYEQTKDSCFFVLILWLAPPKGFAVISLNRII